MTTLLRATRLAAAMLLFGHFTCMLLVLRPGVDASFRPHWQRCLSGACRFSIVLLLASAFPWLATQTMLIGGDGLTNSLPRVLLATGFGHTWLLQLALSLLFACLLPAFGSASSACRQRRLCVPGLTLTGMLLASNALAGHAAASSENGPGLHLLCDASHLLAAGAWYGALPPFAVSLGIAFRAPSSARLAHAACLARRFSLLGTACVSVFLLTGLGNAWIAIGPKPLSFGSAYERLLLLKLLLVLAILCLAAVNHWLLVPRLSTASPRVSDAQAWRALGALHRNAACEFALASTLLLLAAGLGGSVPPGHAQHNSVHAPHAH